MGGGYGQRFVAAILDFGPRRFEPQRHRLYILDWNERSLRTAARLGFAAESRLESDEGTFVVMERPARF